MKPFDPTLASPGVPLPGFDFTVWAVDWVGIKVLKKSNVHQLLCCVSWGRGKRTRENKEENRDPCIPHEPHESQTSHVVPSCAPCQTNLVPFKPLPSPSKLHNS